MPYSSERQRRYMHARHPGIARRWDRKYGGRIVPSPEKKAAYKKSGYGPKFRRYRYKP